MTVPPLAHVVVDALIAFAILGVTEAVVKPVAKLIVQNRLRKYLPVALEFLDLSMPEMIFQYTGNQMNTALKMKLEDTFGKPVSQRDLDAVFNIYDPRISSDFHHEFGHEA
jgi:hypothetical protein